MHTGVMRKVSLGRAANAAQRECDLLEEGAAEKLLCVDSVTNRAADLFASFVSSKIHSSASQRLLASSVSIGLL